MHHHQVDDGMDTLLELVGRMQTYAPILVDTSVVQPLKNIVSHKVASLKFGWTANNQFLFSKIWNNSIFLLPIVISWK